MTRVIWGKTGERFFEAGVDRGMLYVGAVGVAWPGLVSVEERPIGGTAKPYYYEGDKYANISSREEYEATITAFAAPPEFAACDGTAQIASGLFLTQQPRTSFDFSYRTRVGNDVDGADHGYKIHLVYNALAAPASRTNSTLTDASDATAMSWSITTLPPSLSGHRPTAHLVIDSRATDSRLLADLEDILYGSAFLMPRLPQPEEMLTLYGRPALIGRWLGNANASASELVNGRTGEVVRTNLITEPRGTNTSRWSGSAGTGGAMTKTAVTPETPKRTNLAVYPRATKTTTASAWAYYGTGTTTFVTGASDGPEGITSYRRAVQTTTATSGSLGPIASQDVAGVVGDTYSIGMWVRTSRTIRGTWYSRFGSASVVVTSASRAVTIPANTWVRNDQAVTATDTFTKMYSWFVPAYDDQPQENDVFEFTGLLLEKTSIPGTYFDGYSPYGAWTGVVGESPSYLAFNDGPLLPDGTRVGTYIRYRITTQSTGAYLTFYTNPSVSPNLLLPADSLISSALYVRLSALPSTEKWHLESIAVAPSTGSSAQINPPSPYTTAIVGEWVRIKHEGVKTPFDGGGFRTNLTFGSGGSLPVDATVDVTCAMVEPGVSTISDYFDGSTLIP